MPVDERNVFGLSDDEQKTLRRWQERAGHLLSGNSRIITAFSIQFANIMLPYARKLDKVSGGFHRIEEARGGLIFFDKEIIDLGDKTGFDRLSMKRGANYLVRMAADMWPHGKPGFAMPRGLPPLNIREPMMKLLPFLGTVMKPEYNDSVFMLASNQAPADEAKSTGSILSNVLIRQVLPVPCWIEDAAGAGQFETDHGIKECDFGLLLQMRSDIHGASILSKAFTNLQVGFWAEMKDALFAKEVWAESLEHLHLLHSGSFRRPDTLSVMADVSITARLAAIATAGEMAIYAGLVPWTSGEAISAVSRCYAGALQYMDRYMAPSAENWRSKPLAGGKVWPGYQSFLPKELHSRWA
mgnify:CR=1 FL=1